MYVISTTNDISKETDKCVTRSRPVVAQCETQVKNGKRSCHFNFTVHTLKCNFLTRLAVPEIPCEKFRRKYAADPPFVTAIRRFAENLPSFPAISYAPRERSKLLVVYKGKFLRYFCSYFAIDRVYERMRGKKRRNILSPTRLN